MNFQATSKPKSNFVSHSLSNGNNSFQKQRNSALLSTLKPLPGQQASFNLNHQHHKFLSSKQSLRAIFDPVKVKRNQMIQNPQKIRSIGIFSQNVPVMCDNLWKPKNLGYMSQSWGFKSLRDHLQQRPTISTRGQYHVTRAYNSFPYDPYERKSEGDSFTKRISEANNRKEKEQTLKTNIAVAERPESNNNSNGKKKYAAWKTLSDVEEEVNAVSRHKTKAIDKQIQENQILKTDQSKMSPAKSTNLPPPPPPPQNYKKTWKDLARGADPSNISQGKELNKSIGSWKDLNAKQTDPNMDYYKNFSNKTDEILTNKGQTKAEQDLLDLFSRIDEMTDRFENNDEKNKPTLDQKFEAKADKDFKDDKADKEDKVKADKTKENLKAKADDKDKTDAKTTEIKPTKADQAMTDIKTKDKADDEPKQKADEKTKAKADDKPKAKADDKPKAKAEESNDYLVSFKIPYKAKYGESLCIVGSLGQLGNWEEFVAKMTWQEGDVWALECVNISAKDAVFQYKYMVLKNGKPQKWEDGYNRIADLKLLSVQNNKASKLGFNDLFNMYSVNFKIDHSLTASEQMKINGDTAQLGSWHEGNGPQSMDKSAKKLSQRHFWFKQGKGWDSPTEISYKYQIRNDNENTTFWEREPSRILSILDPKDYKGEQGKQGSNSSKNTSKCFIVNGHIDKSDANFSDEFKFDKIGDTSIYIGPYPQSRNDFKLLEDKGITGVLNSQTHLDMDHRGINHSKIFEQYKARNMEQQHFPIKSFSENDQKRRLFEGAQRLNDMINKGQKVYVHCTAGIGRSTAIVLVYLCIYKKCDCWEKPDEVNKWVKSFRSVSAPNMSAVKAVVEENSEFQQQLFEKD